MRPLHEYILRPPGQYLLRIKNNSLYPVMIRSDDPWAPISECRKLVELQDISVYGLIVYIQIDHADKIFILELWTKCNKNHRQNCSSLNSILLGCPYMQPLKVSYNLNYICNRFNKICPRLNRSPSSGVRRCASCPWVRARRRLPGSCSPTP
jgi:hypothetical protein